jgi:hypothetical protein
LNGNPVYNAIVTPELAIGGCDSMGFTCTETYVAVTTLVDRVTLAFPPEVVSAGIDNFTSDDFGDDFNPGDSRINRTSKDRAAPVTIYCTEGGGILVLRVDQTTSRGIDPAAVDITQEAIDAVGIPQGSDVQLASKDGVTLWRLTTGWFRVETFYPREPSKLYVVDWDACPATQISHILI